MVNAATNARETGCSECRASAAAWASAVAAVIPARTLVPASTKPSRVSVPVLSNMTVSTLANASKASSLRTNTPRRAKAPAAASMAAGVASDKAQGQVTTNTATATISAWPGSCRHP